MDDGISSDATEVDFRPSDPRGKVRGPLPNLSDIIKCFIQVIGLIVVALILWLTWIEMEEFITFDIEKVAYIYVY